MAKSTRTKSIRAENSGNMFAQQTDAGAVWLEGFVRAGQVCAKGLTEWNREAFRFAETRLDANNDVAARLGSCKSIAEVASLQQSWASEAMEAYMSEVAKLANLGMRIMSGSMSVIPDTVESSDWSKTA